MKSLSNMVRDFFLREGAGLLLICLLLLLDSLLSAAIIWKVPYTEIDWKAYMEEVAGYESGERDYTKIEGCTGPLVYPAGFLYIFSFLKSVTSNGSDILRAQIIFAGLYILTLAVSLILYHKGRFPAFCAIFLILSKRVHSIFMLRMFNDCVAVFLGLVAVVCFCTRSWRLGSVVYSISVSIKMNMLLYAPGVLAIYLLNLGYLGAVENIVICGIVQLVLGYPFLTTFPVAYISKAFELSRVFFYKWTVNFKFLPEDVFLDKRLSILLLALTVAAYVAFSFKWTTEFCKGFQQHSKEKLSLTSRKTNIGQFVSWNFITYVIFASNFIGIAFARSLHYQFYCWYFFTLPFLLFQSYLHEVFSIVVLGGFEYAFNVFPATALSSSVLQVCHVLMLAALWFSRVPFKEGETVAKLYVESLQTKRK